MTDQAHDRDDAFLRDSARVGANLIALIAARFICLALTLVQMALVFKTLGVEKSGQFVFALGYAALFNVFATCGIQRLLVRDIARNPAIAWDYVWTATAVVACLSAIVFCVIASSIVAVEQTPVVRAAVMLAAVSVVVLWALQSPFEALLTARERMGYVGVVYMAAGILKLISVYLVLQGAPSSAAAHGVIALANLAAFMLCIAFAVRVAGWQPPRIKPQLAFAQLRDSFPFMVAMMCSQVYVKADMSILKFMKGDVAAGIYGPPQRLLEPIMMIAGLWGTVVFPALCRTSIQAPDDYRRLRSSALRLAVAIALPLAVGIACLAKPVIQLLAGPDFAQSVGLLRLMAIVIPLFYINGIGQEFLYASHRNWLVVRAYALAAVVSIVANVLAIYWLGVFGVAVAAVAANLAVTTLFAWCMRKELGAMNLPLFTIKTALSSAAMAAAVLWTARYSWLLSVPAAVCIYTAAQMLLRTLDPTERRILRHTALGIFNIREG